MDAAQNSALPELYYQQALPGILQLCQSLFSSWPDMPFRRFTSPR